MLMLLNNGIVISFLGKTESPTCSNLLAQEDPKVNNINRKLHPEHLYSW